MKFRKIKTEDGKGSFIFGAGEDAEFANPLEYFMEIFVKHRTFVLQELTKREYRKKGISDGAAMDYLLKEAIKEWKEYYNSIMVNEVPENFLTLLESKSKKEQVKLLKGQKLNTDTLSAFIFNSWLKHKYTFSQYRSEHFSKDVKKESLPIVVHLNEEETIEKVGETSLSDGKLKQVLEHRKVIVAKVFDRNSEWHCFITTFNNLAGKESWKGGTSHLHYISDKWGISREELVSRIKSGRYPTTSVHVDISTHRNE